MSPTAVIGRIGGSAGITLSKKALFVDQPIKTRMAINATLTLTMSVIRPEAESRSFPITHLSTSSVPSLPQGKLRNVLSDGPPCLN
jgi:hypothetical protein